MLAFPSPWLVPGVLCVALCSATFAAAAQAAAPDRRPDPLDVRAAVPAVRYDSALSRARRAPADEPSIPWREANDAAARIGGWRAYAREAQQPDTTPVAPADAHAPRSDKGKPNPAGSGAHGGHKTP